MVARGQYEALEDELRQRRWVPEGDGGLFLDEAVLSRADEHMAALQDAVHRRDFAAIRQAVTRLRQLTVGADG